MRGVCSARDYWECDRRADLGADGVVAAGVCDDALRADERAARLCDLRQERAAVPVNAERVAGTF